MGNLISTPAASPGPNPYPAHTEQIAAPSTGMDQKFIGLDLLRFVSVVAIVWFHANAPGAQFAYSGLPALLLISLLLPMIRDKGKPLVPIFIKRAERLLIPWVYWSFVYGIYFAQNAVRRGKPFYEDFEPWMAFTGPMVHLWYLPFVFVASTVGLVLFRWLLPLRIRYSVPILMVLGCAFLWAKSHSDSNSTPWAQWFFGAVSVPFGLAISLVVRKCNGFNLELGLALISAMVLTVAVTLIFQTGPEQGMPYAIGVALVCLGLVRSPGNAELVEKWNQVTFGIYVLHPLVFALITNRILKEKPYEEILAAILATGISWAGTIILKKTPIHRFI